MEDYRSQSNNRFAVFRNREDNVCDQSEHVIAIFSSSPFSESADNVPWIDHLSFGHHWITSMPSFRGSNGLFWWVDHEPYHRFIAVKLSKKEVTQICQAGPQILPTKYSVLHTCWSLHLHFIFSPFAESQFLVCYCLFRDTPFELYPPYLFVRVLQKQ